MTKTPTLLVHAMVVTTTITARKNITIKQQSVLPG